MSNSSNPDDVRGSMVPLARCSQIDECAVLPIAAMEGATHILRQVNPAFCALVGKNKEDLLGKPFAEALPDGDAWLSTVNRVCLAPCKPEVQTEGEREEQRSLYWMFSVWPKDGQERPEGVMIQVNGTPDIPAQARAMTQALMLTAVRNHALKEEAERLNAQLGAENAERKLVQEQLLASLKEISDLQAAVDEHAIVAVTDPQGRITYANDKFCALSKYSREELLGQNHRIVNSGFHPREFMRNLWTTIGRGKVWKGEIKNRAKDGTYYWVDTTIVPFLNAAGKPFRYVAIRTDITAQKASEFAIRESQREAEQATRAKDNFIAALSHELRTPLTPILLIAESLEANERLDPDTRAQIMQIRQNAALEAQLIDDLLDVTKIARQKINLRPEPVDLHQLLSSALDTVDNDLSRKGIVARVQANARFFCADADPTRIQQVFWNLIKNAAKFTHEGGTIEIRTFNEDDRSLSIEIRDSGIGISPENLPSLFDPFEQGAATGNPRFGGLGLGLTISKAIVELHDGTIAATSDGVGLGATFTVRLPVSRLLIAVQAPPAIPSVRRASHLHILLVEDHEQTRDVLARLLCRDGHRVEAVDTCMAARKACEGCNRDGEHPFQVVVSDLGLPDGSGLDLIREIKAHFPDINAVAVSGFGTEDDKRRSAEAGFVHHLTKPIAMEALRRALAA